MKSIIIGKVSLNPEAFIGIGKEDFMKMKLNCEKENAWNLIQAELAANGKELKQDASTGESGEKSDKRKRKGSNEGATDKPGVQGENNSTEHTGTVV